MSLKLFCTQVSKNLMLKFLFLWPEFLSFLTFISPQNFIHDIKTFYFHLMLAVTNNMKSFNHLIFSNQIKSWCYHFFCSPNCVPIENSYWKIEITFFQSFWPFYIHLFYVLLVKCKIKIQFTSTVVLVKSKWACKM